MAADGQHDVATGAGELVGDLHAGGGGADDQDAAVGELVGVAVRRRGDLRDGPVEPGGHGRHAGLVAPPGGDHDVGGRATRASSVRTAKPPSARSRERTGLCSWTGAAKEPA